MLPAALYACPAGGFLAPYLTHVGISLMFALVAGGLVRCPCRRMLLPLLPLLLLPLLALPMDQSVLR